MSWFSRLLNLFRRDHLDHDLEEELQFHLEAKGEQLTAGGMTRSEAMEAARRRLGNTVLLRESSRDIKLIPGLESIVQDVAFGLRLCRKNLVLSGAAVVSLSLAIGTCAAAFSLIDALILRPLPVSDPERLVLLTYRPPGEIRESLSFNYPLFERLRDASRSQVQLFGMSDQSRRDAVFDDTDGQLEKVYGQWISGDAFGVLGVKPALGRLFTLADDQKPGRHPVAVLSYDFWSRRFAKNPAVLGRWLTIRDKQLQIIGVAEKGFTGVEPGIMTDVWAPNMMWDDRAISDAGTRWFRVWGRLQPGWTAEQARPVLQTVFTNFRREQAGMFPVDAPKDRIESFVNTLVYLRSAANGASGLREYFARALWVLAAIAFLVLLIACANVASLLVARAAARDREMALRISIGAGRGRLIQQVLIESAILSISSCALGALIAVIAAPQVVSMLSTSRSVIRLDLHPDWRLIGFLTGAGSLVTLLFGLAPAFRASSVSPNNALKSGSGKQTARVGLFRPLIAAQTAFSFIVLFIAGMCLASFWKLVQTDVGFDRNNLAIVTVQAPALRDGGAKALAVWHQLSQRLAQAPGIQSVSLSAYGLFRGSGRNKSLRIPGRPVDSYDPWYLAVSPGFLGTMDISLTEGRDLEWRDVQRESPSAVIVNQSFAKRYFPGESPVGKRFFRADGPTLVAQDIIGVAEDAKYTSLREEAPPTVYDSLRSQDGSAAVQVRTKLAPAELATLLRDQLPRIHPALRMTDITPQSTLIDNTLVRDRALALLAVFFSAVAIVLVGVGLYGVLSYSVVQRTRDIGIRLALGALPLRVVGLIVSEAVVVTVIGLLLGAVGGAVASQFIKALLFEVKPDDFWSITAPLACLIGASALAVLVPALRAARVDPVTALRYE